MKNLQKGETSSGGIGVLGLLGVAFVILKIVDVKPIGDWSWWWVTSPFWGGFLLAAVIIGILLVASAMTGRR